MELLADAHGRQHEASRKRHVQTIEGVNLGGAGRRCVLVDGGVSGAPKQSWEMMRAFGSVGRVGPSFVFALGKRSCHCF